MAPALGRLRTITRAPDAAARFPFPGPILPARARRSGRKLTSACVTPEGLWASRPAPRSGLDDRAGHDARTVQGEVEGVREVEHVLVEDPAEAFRTQGFLGRTRTRPGASPSPSKRVAMGAVRSRNSAWETPRGISGAGARPRPSAGERRAVARPDSRARASDTRGRPGGRLRGEPARSKSRWLRSRVGARLRRSRPRLRVRSAAAPDRGSGRGSRPEAHRRARPWRAGCRAVRLRARGSHCGGIAGGRRCGSRGPARSSTRSPRRDEGDAALSQRFPEREPQAVRVRIAHQEPTLARLGPRHETTGFVDASPVAARAVLLELDLLARIGDPLQPGRKRWGQPWPRCAAATKTVVVSKKIAAPRTDDAAAPASRCDTASRSISR